MSLSFTFLVNNITIYFFSQPKNCFLVLILQMKYSFFDFLGTPLIPELCSDIAACSSCNIHLVLITVATVRAFPYKFSVIICYNLYLSVITAYLAIVALCIKFSIHDIVINVLHDRNYSRNVILHIRYFNITYGTAW